jgi:agmatinase
MPGADQFKHAGNFLGLPDELSAPDKARVWVLPIPYEGTTSYGKGTCEGPAAIIAASRQVEWYDRDVRCEPVRRFGVHTLNPLREVYTSPQAMVQPIEESVAGIMGGTPHPNLLCGLGGEHTVSAGIVRGLAKALGGKDLVCVQIDAHADLRDTYDGTPYSHACAARRILETCPVFQIGIRNISEEEELFRRKSNRVRTVFAPDATAARPKFLSALSRFVHGKTVFLTIDLDGLDPSIMPAVGTPEPGGLSWERVLEIVRVVCRDARRVAAFDIVELAPVPGMRGPDFLAALLAYRIMTLATAAHRA